MNLLKKNLLRKNLENVIIILKKTWLNINNEDNSRFEFDL